jgi:hypothetical protein
MFCEMLQRLSIVHQFRLSQGYRHHSLQEAQRKVADMQAKAKVAEEAKKAKVTLLEKALPAVPMSEGADGRRFYGTALAAPEVPELFYA